MFYPCVRVSRNAFHLTSCWFTFAASEFHGRVKGDYCSKDSMEIIPGPPASAIDHEYQIWRQVQDNAQPWQDPLKALSMDVGTFLT